MRITNSCVCGRGHAEVPGACGATFESNRAWERKLCLGTDGRAVGLEAAEGINGAIHSGGDTLCNLQSLRQSCKVLSILSFYLLPPESSQFTVPLVEVVAILKSPMLPVP